MAGGLLDVCRMPYRIYGLPPRRDLRGSKRIQTRREATERRPAWLGARQPIEGVGLRLLLPASRLANSAGLLEREARVRDCGSTRPPERKPGRAPQRSRAGRRPLVVRRHLVAGDVVLGDRMGVPIRK